MSQIKRRRSSYEAGFKLKVVEFAEAHSNSAAMREFGVDEKLVRDWRKMKEFLTDMPSSKCARRGDVSSFPALEDELNEWILELRQNGLLVTRCSIRLHALQLKKSDKYRNQPGMATFRASAGWCSRFMERHLLTLRHSGWKPYACKICGNTFSQVKSLEEHERIHSGEKPYVCKICTKAFNQLGNLKTHERIHIGKKPFICYVCGRTFSRRDYVTRHHRMQHGQELQCVSHHRISKKSSSKDSRWKHLKHIDTGQKSVGMIWNKQEMKSLFAVKPFGCGFCDEIFVEETHFLKHCSLHIGVSDISQDLTFHSDCHGIVSNEKLKEGFIIRELSNKLRIESNTDELRENSFRWFGHTQMIN